jgi:protein-S-isoprenylcysteine O-methyltransferase Ste14
VLTVQAALGIAFLLALWRAGPTTDSLALRILAGLAAAAAILVGLVSLWQLRHSFRPAPTPADEGRLERGGIYCWLRHPMYHAVLGLVLAGCLWRPHPAVLVVGALHYLFYRAKSRYEERLLRQRYESYADYRRRTWGLGP